MIEEDRLTVAHLLTSLNFDPKHDLDDTLRWALIELKLRRETPVTKEDLSDMLEVWDQTVGCSNCQQAYWGDRATGPDHSFHQSWCPLYLNDELGHLAKFK